MTCECARPVFVSGGRVVIRWIFNFLWAGGSTTRMEEPAWQRREGEQMADGTFFYDPAQRTRVPAKLVLAFLRLAMAQVGMPGPGPEWQTATQAAL